MTDPQPEAAERPQRRQLSRRERAMILVLLIALVGGAAYFVLTTFAGDDRAEPERPGPTATEPDVEPTARPSPTVSPTPTEEAAPQTFGAFVGRDPFEPLVKPPQEPAPGDGAAADGDADGDGEPDDPSAGGPARKRVALMDIFTEDGDLNAVVEVDGKEFTVAEGDVFADNFRLDNLTSQCADFTFGDEGFRLCIGQETRK